MIRPTPSSAAGTGLAMWVLALAVVLPGPALARPNVTTPPPSGTYESYSPVLGTFVGPIEPAAARRLLGHWLEVTTRGNESTVVMQPGGAVRWALRYGPQGLQSKIISVEGWPWARSDFEYPPGGAAPRLKRLSGPVTLVELLFDYRLDARGRIVERTRRPLAGQGRSGDRWEVTHGPAGSVATTFLADVAVRRDQFDPEGRLLLTEVGRPVSGPARLALRYLRDRSGKLMGVERVLGQRPARPADPTVREADVGPTDLVQISSAVERHEVLLLLGSPVTHSVDGQGLGRKVRDQYSPKCWLNQPSTLEYDPADLVKGSRTNCVCGFCVDARASVEARQVVGRDWHWTRGPWLRLDGQLELTADHRVMTPAGPVRADQLRPGHEVLDAAGRPRRLRSVERLGSGRRAQAERLGLNVRTASGRFAAGGFLLQSETGRPCR